jgi:hypothetical protein
LIKNRRNKILCNQIFVTFWKLGCQSLCATVSSSSESYHLENQAISTTAVWSREMKWNKFCYSNRVNKEGSKLKVDMKSWFYNIIGGKCVLSLYRYLSVSCQSSFAAFKCFSKKFAWKTLEVDIGARKDKDMCLNVCINVKYKIFPCLVGKLFS